MMEPPAIDPGRHALFLDFDGTLVGFVDDPAKVAIRPAARDRLEELAEALSGALAIVSGRRIADLDRFLAPLEFAAAGVHGLERRGAPGGKIERLAGPELLDDTRERLSETLAGNPRLRLEDKGTALVLHYRNAADLEDMARRAMDQAVAGRHDLVVMNGDNIVEVHPAGMDKGVALAAIMEAPPFAGRLPVYVGDDTTDEYALKTAREAGGVSIKVGSKDSVAEYRLKDVAAVHRWLGVPD
ncbi:trehalose-phosphatase [Aurantimonas sp. VKM B-3413]|uniref:trehalose-phosphatase n=1 Tax=Aurantimonas sp. VKM B-3413 TaxID=2779401 RepID=UPI001E5FE40D|nr:trehalose-phosphatase [Aurantimonas sp. VKM B-3413]MCB8838785.1 trehalose-phosphatase [Aurantimonas sp. VKM B-3413]